MQFSINDMLYAFSYALDCVEHDLIGVSTHHGLRVACMSILMGKELGIEEEPLIDLAACSILHDNALTEYIRTEWRSEADISVPSRALDLKPHCLIGEKNLQAFPFQSEVKGSILYHHEHANGSGPFGRTAEETPLTAQLIHLGDQMDAKWNLNQLTEEKYEGITHYVHDNTNKLFSAECVNAFDRTCTFETLKRFETETPDSIIRQLLPRRLRTFTPKESIGFSDIFASIIDYKSSFTSTHSKGVASLCATMGRYYGYSEPEILKLYFAGAVHDVGKLVIDQDILEKPDKLTYQEFIHIQNHAYYSHAILSSIEGFEDIAGWASLHHEKLNGSGYPFGKCGEELNKNERLMACIDIYQALTEERPYKKGFSHKKTIQMLNRMAQDGLIDGSIVNDLSHVLKNTVI